MRTFLVRYRYEGAEYGLELKATDLADAQRRVSQLGFAKLDGELITTVPAALGLLAIAAAAIQNGLARALGKRS